MAAHARHFILLSARVISTHATERIEVSRSANFGSQVGKCYVLLPFFLFSSFYKSFRVCEGVSIGFHEFTLPQKSKYKQRFNYFFYNVGNFIRREDHMILSSYLTWTREFLHSSGETDSPSKLRRVITWLQKFSGSWRASARPHNITW